LNPDGFESESLESESLESESLESESLESAFAAVVDSILDAVENAVAGTGRRTLNFRLKSARVDHSPVWLRVRCWVMMVVPLVEVTVGSLRVKPNDPETALKATGRKDLVPIRMVREFVLLFA
jgi:hypothetical protein